MCFYEDPRREAYSTTGGARSLLLWELYHTTRDYVGYLLGLQHVQYLLSKFAEAAPGEPGCAVAARRLMPSFTFTDKDFALLNALCLQLNGEK